MEEIELIEKRKPREKHFLQKDGTIIAKVYDTDIHFLKDGKYEEIDNSLVKSGNLLVNKNNDFKVKFEETLNKYLMKMEKDGNYLNIRLSDCNHSKIITGESPSKLEQSVFYENVMEDISIQYKTLPNKVKETIVLKNNKYSKIHFIAETNLELLMEDKCIIATKNGEKVFELEAPYMEDSEGKVNNNVYYHLIEHEDHYDIELNLDSNWLNSLDIKYPVYVDPTISNSSENLNLYDTYIYPGDTNDNRGNKQYLKAGVERVNGKDVINRTLIKFDLPTIGTGYEIVNAMLNIYPFAGGKVSDYEHLVEVHRVTSDWTESGATWNSMHDKFDNRVEDIESFYRSEIVNNKPQVYPHTVYITGLVKKWYEDTPNYGIMIKSCEEIYKNDNFPMFFSNNTTIEGNPQPIFIIQYRNNNGIEEYWDYKSQSFTDGQAHVNTHTGNLTTVFNIGNTIGGVMPASIDLVYNTNDLVLDNETFFGKGFKLNLEQVIERIDNSLQYLDEDGTIHYFYKEESYPNEENTEYNNTYYDEDGLNLKIEDLDTTLKMTDSNSNEMTFTKIGEKYYLTLIKDVDNNTISIELNNNNSISKVVDKYNSEITIDYNNENIIVHSSDGTQTKLNYTSNQLTSIESINGITTFSYNNNSVVSSIIDVTGLRKEYEYYDKIPYKIKKITDYGLNNTLGNTCSFIYSLYETTIKDDNGLIETIAFNDYGNTVSRNILKDQDGIDDAYSIEKTYNDKNKLTSNMLPSRYIRNYLENTSFESDNNLFYSEDGIETSFDDNNANSGLRSLKIESSISNKSVEQDISIKKGEYYTFSGYLKSNVPIQLLLCYTNADGNEVISSEMLQVSEDFEREDVTIYYEENASSNLKIRIKLLEVGTVYLDDIQLEKGEVANCYNIIENSDFKNGLTGWNCSARIGDNEVDPSDYIDVIDINESIKAMKIKMQHNLSTSVNKKYNIKGKKGDSYTLSFWYKNEATIPFAPYVGSNVSIFYEPYDTDNGHCILSRDLPITNGNSWQHFVYTEESIEDFKSIQINFFNTWSGNHFQVTNLSFYKNVSRGEYEYDENGNLISIKDQDGKITVLNYKDNKIVDSTSLSGKNVKYEYANDKQSRLLNTIGSNGISNKISYNDDGAMITSKIAKTYTKNLVDGLYSIRSKGTDNYIKAELFTALLEKNECSNTVWKLQKEGEYFKLIYSVQPCFSLSHKNGVITLDTSDSDNLFILEENDNGSYKIKYEENNSDNLTFVRTIKADGNLLKISEEAENDFDSEFYIEPLKELFVENDTEYTEDGRFIKELTDSNFRKTSFVTNSTTGLVESVTDTTGVTTEHTYNDKRQVVSTKYGDKTVSYEYNDKNMLKKIILDDKEYNLNYDNFLRVSGVSLGNNINFAEHTYINNSGNISSTTYGNGNSILYEYDEFNRLKRIKREDDNFSYKYNYKGDVVKIISANNTLKYNYDESGKLNEYKNNEYKIKYTYDSNSNLIKKTYKLDSKEKSRITHLDENEIPTSVQLENDVITYEVDNLNRVISKTINNIINTQYKYLSNGKRTSNVIEKYKFKDKEYFYKYDDAYNIKEIYCNDILTKSYNYDMYGELVNENNYDSGYKVSYLYDNSANIKQMKIMDFNDTIIKVNNYSYDNENWNDQLTAFNGINFEYDAIGNLTKIGDDNLSWINGNSLSSYAKEGKTINFTYDVGGLRKSKIVDEIETKYFRDEDKIIYEKRGNNIIYYLYDLGELIGMEYNNMRYYYVKNLQNDVLGIMDSYGNQIVSYIYDSWGNLLEISDSQGNIITDSNNIGYINPFRYRGYYYDSETELYYLNSRYYCPKIGRFISPDTVLGANEDILSYNLYAYVGNDPINHTDYFGNKKSKLAKWFDKQLKKVKKAINKAVSRAIKKVSDFVGTYINKKTVVTSKGVSTSDPLTAGMQAGGNHKTVIKSVGNKKAPITIEHDVGKSVTIQAGRYGVKVGDSFEVFTSVEKKKGVTETHVWLGVERMYLYHGLDREVQDEYSEADYNTIYAHAKMNVLVPVAAAVVVDVAISVGISALAEGFSQGRIFVAGAAKYIETVGELAKKLGRSLGRT